MGRMLQLATIALAVVLIAAMLVSPAQAANVDGRTIYPGMPDPGYGFVEWLQATDDGVIVKLTWAGLAKARDEDGAREVATWVSELYMRLPPKAKRWWTIDWAINPLGREIRYHALAYQWWPQLSSRANPVNARFSDYWSGAGWWAWWID